MAAAPVFAAGPSGGMVSAGAVSITQSSAQTTIKQTTDKAVINWADFSIGGGSTVRFMQPSASSIALNRVTGSRASVIQGSLQANGQVWVLNPNGVLIAPSGQVAAGSFLATTRSLTDQQFMAGNYAFTDGGVAGASVINQGSLIVAEGGYAVLAGEAVRNEGYIEASLGQVVLGGAKAFTLDLSGDNTLAFVVTAPVDVTPTDGKAVVDNSGSIQAAGGRVLMTARAASQVVGQVINTGGVVAATSAQLVNGKIVLDGGTGSVSVAGDLNASGKGAGQTGGAIDVNAQKIQVKATAKLDVSGDAGGGKIAIGGGGPNTRTQSFTPAESTTIAAGARLDASALTRGDGGEIVVFTSLTNRLALTQVAGSLIARGGTQGGNGGFVETSGYRLNVDGIVVDASAPKGRRGLWLLDPADVEIGTSAAGSPCTIESIDCTYLNGGAQSTKLGSPAPSGTNTTISATNSIVVNDMLAWSSEAILTLAAPTIRLNSSITAGKGSLKLNGTTIEIKSGALLGGVLEVNATGGIPAGSSFTVPLSGASVTAGSVTLRATTVTINKAISTTVGDLTIGGVGGAQNVTINGNLNSSNNITVGASGTLNLGANLTACGDCGGSTLSGLTVNVTSAVTQSGPFTINATDPLGSAGVLNINSAYKVNAGGNLIIVADTLSLNANLTVDGFGDLGLTAKSQLNWNSAVVVDAGTSTIKADKIAWGGGGFTSSNGRLVLSNTNVDAVNTIQFTSTEPVRLKAQTELNILSPMSWSGFTLKLGGTVFLSSTLTGTAGASLSLEKDFGVIDVGTNGPVTLNGTAVLSSVFKVNDIDKGSGTTNSGGVLVTVTNPAGGGEGGGGGSSETTVVVAPVTTTTATNAAATAAAKAAADAAAAKVIADAAAAKAATLDTTTKLVVEQAITQAVATVVASTSSAVFVAPAPPPPATSTTPGASTTTSTDTTATSSSASTTTTTTAATTTTSTTTTTATTATTTATASTAQGTTVTQEFVEPLTVATLSSTTSTVSDPGDTSAATTSATSGPASQTATPASTATAAPAAPSLTPVAVSRDGADAGDFTLQTVKPPAPVTTAKQEARPAERVTNTPVSPGIALQATQKTPPPSGSVLGREISGVGNSSAW